jgi:hypothetical protein
MIFMLCQIKASRAGCQAHPGEHNRSKRHW